MLIDRDGGRLLGVAHPIPPGMRVRTGRFEKQFWQEQVTRPVSCLHYHAFSKESVRRAGAVRSGASASKPVESVSAVISLKTDTQFSMKQEPPLELLRRFSGGRVHLLVFLKRSQFLLHFGESAFLVVHCIAKRL